MMNIHLLHKVRYLTSLARLVPLTALSRKSVLLPALCLALASTTVLAGEYNEEHLKREISYLAKKLLDMSGKDSVTVESPAYIKPFIGICAEMEREGIRITCVTPGTQAAKNGLKTGDLVTRMKGINVQNEDLAKTKKTYYKIVDEMKTGDKIDMAILRDNKPVQLVVTVGSLSHPAYKLEVNK